MFHILINLDTTNQGFIHLLTQQYLICNIEGECDLLIDNDKSISRKHTVITVKDGDELEFEDFSKYGTEVNNSKLEKKKKVVIRSETNSNTVKFGVDKSAYSLAYEKMVFSSSERLRDAVQRLCRDHYLEFIDLDSNHVGSSGSDQYFFVCSTDELSDSLVSTHLLRALILGYNIVTLEYLQKVCEIFDNKDTRSNPLPNYSEYEPTATYHGKTLSLKSNPKRTQLFNGQSILFCDKNMYNKYSALIQSGDGTAMFDPIPDSLDSLDQFFSKYSSSIIMQSDQGRSDLNAGQRAFVSVLVDLVGFEFLSEKQLIQSIVTCSVISAKLPSRDAYLQYCKRRAEEEESNRRREENEKRERERLEQERREADEKKKRELEQKQRQHIVVKQEEDGVVNRVQHSTIPTIKKEKNSQSDDDETEDERETKVVSRKNRKRTRSSQSTQEKQDDSTDKEVSEESQSKKQKTEKTSQDYNNLECYISVEYVDLVPVKKDPVINAKNEPASSGSSTSYNAKKFRKSKVGLQAFSQSSQDNNMTPTANSRKILATQLSDESLSAASLNNNNSSNHSSMLLRDSSESDRNSSIPNTNTNTNTNSSNEQSKSDAAAMMTFEVEDDTEQDEEYQERVQKIFAHGSDEDDEDSDDEEALDLLNADVAPKNKAPARRKK